MCVSLGYIQEEKVEIAHRHLIPHQLEQHGLTPQQLQIPQDTTHEIISKYAHTHIYTLCSKQVQANNIPFNPRGGQKDKIKVSRQVQSLSIKK